MTTLDLISQARPVDHPFNKCGSFPTPPRFARRPGAQHLLLHGVIDGELAWRQHSGGHTTGPNWRTFLDWANRYIKSP